MLPKAIEVVEGILDPAVRNPAVAEVEAVPERRGRVVRQKARQARLAVEVDEAAGAAGIDSLGCLAPGPADSHVRLNGVAGGAGGGQDKHWGTFPKLEAEGVIGFPA